MAKEARPKGKVRPADLRRAIEAIVRRHGNGAQGRGVALGVAFRDGKRERDAPHAAGATARRHAATDMLHCAIGGLLLFIWISTLLCVAAKTCLCCPAREPPMFALLSLVVCLAGSPVVCETVTPDHVRRDTGEPPTFFECLGPSGQEIARKWLDEHPAYRLRRIQCSVANDPERLREQVESPRA
jgi:hypothetical protein